MFSLSSIKSYYHKERKFEIFKKYFSILKLIFAVIIFFNSELFSQSPHGTSIKIDCSDCHESTSWNIISSRMKFNHDLTNYKLIGQHKSISCRSCHKSLNFSNINSDCISCHTNVHKNSVTMDCNKCHNPQSWLVANINEIHQKGRFPLLGAHSKADCKQCHSKYSELNFEVLGINCVDCHLNDFNSTLNPNHVIAGFSRDCQTCHLMTGSKWNYLNVAHNFFPLLEGHSLSNCFKCHQQNNFKGLSQDCYSCHKANYESAQNPNHLNNQFGKDCKQCHSINGWKPATFNHNLTSFSLTGAHTSTSCEKCHKNGYSTLPPKDCYSCHQASYNSTVNPNHISVNFPKECQQCHSTNGWKPASFDHDGKYFPVYSGEHRNKWNSCIDCHNNSSNYKIFTCLTGNCHPQNKMNQEHNNVNGYVYESNACLSCHPNGKKDGAFNHNNSNFPLTGAHTSVQCSQCHLNGYAQKPPVDCYSCHKNDFNNSTKPNHLTLNFSQECNQCHDNIAWNPAPKFNHSLTGFTLTGKHSITCNKCHNEFYSNTLKTCYDCHKNDFNNAVNPNHLTAQFPKNCDECHSINGWKPSTFNHDGVYFPIYSGKHKNKWDVCTDCHPNQASLKIFSCYQSCHEHNKQKMDNEHQGINGYVYQSESCLNCHPNGTGDGSFNHTTTNFILSGSHLTLICFNCHQNGFKNTPAQCLNCHEETLIQTNPNHKQIGMSNDCKNCHNTSAWIPSSFNHQNTLFPLTGKHVNTNCSSCHIGKTTGTSQDCFVCHQVQYNNATNPKHKNLNPPLPTTCKDCHNTNPSWKPATFSIHNTYFVLQGAHLSIANDCYQCHQGIYTTTPNTCWGCHQDDFNNSTNPNHVAANLSHQCTDCHNENVWTGAKYLSHDPQYFKIYSGKHKNRWNGCGDRCHPVQSNYSNFTCFPCHTKSTMDNEHRNVTNYQYLNSACYNCHRNVDLFPTPVRKNILN